VQLCFAGGVLFSSCVALSRITFLGWPHIYPSPRAAFDASVPSMKFCVNSRA
jgi:hypothetical protein